MVGCTSPCAKRPLYSFISASVFGREALKISLVPSGEKKAPPSYPNSSVICFTLLPSRFIVYSSKSPLRMEVKTILSPCGETVASASYPGSLVSWSVIFPCKSETNMSKLSYTGQTYFPFFRRGTSGHFASTKWVEPYTKCWLSGKKYAQVVRPFPVEIIGGTLAPLNVSEAYIKNIWSHSTRQSLLLD